MEERKFSPFPLSDELSYEISLRPRFLSEYIGQERIKQNLRIFIEAAKKRAEPLDHVLLYGPPGLGKTTLAYIVSNELGVNIKTTSGPAIERPGDLAAILTNLEERDVLFIDEIHRLSRVIEEKLYPAMEEYKLDIIIGQGPYARTVRLDLPKFTLIGATTRTGMITSPLRDRFGVHIGLDFYSEQELIQIIMRSARILKIDIDIMGAEEIAKRARGTPRIANRLLRRVRDFAQIMGDGIITSTIAKKALEMMDVDPMGLDITDRKILLTIIEKFNGGPVGLETIATALNEDKDTIEDVYEPYLIRCGYIKRTQRGRIATQLAYEHLKISYNKKEGTLF